MVYPFSIAILLGTLATAGAQAQAADEYHVKAAFLYNFAKFVEWPPETFKGPTDAITICVLGIDPFGSALEETVNGKVVEGRPFAVRHTSDAKPASGCQIVFVSSSERKRSRSIVGDLKNSGVLTVGEMEGFGEDGGVINFKIEDGKVLIEINPDAAQQARLRISSKLLSLARIVRNSQDRNSQDRNHQDKK
jgi:hypothetical protein